MHPRLILDAATCRWLIGIVWRTGMGWVDNPQSCGGTREVVIVSLAKHVHPACFGPVGTEGAIVTHGGSRGQLRVRERRIKWLGWNGRKPLIPLVVQRTRFGRRSRCRWTYGCRPRVGIGVISGVTSLGKHLGLVLDLNLILALVLRIEVCSQIACFACVRDTRRHRVVLVLLDGVTVFLWSLQGIRMVRSWMLGRLLWLVLDVCLR
jgi:hypothetical protein